MTIKVNTNLNFFDLEHIEDAFKLSQNCFIQIEENQENIFSIKNALGLTESLFGLEKETLMGKNFLDFLEIKFKHKFENAFTKSKKDLETIILHGTFKIKSENIYFFIKLKVLKDENEKYLWTGIIQDISKDVIKEKELNDLKRKIQEDSIEKEYTLEFLNIGLWNYDPKSHKTTWDKSMFKLFEIKAEDYSDYYQVWESFIHPEDKDKVLLDLANALEGDDHFNSKFRIITESSEIKSLGASAYIKRDESGKAIKLYGINWDNTTQENLEKQREHELNHLYQSAKLITIGEMAGGIAHEINNPLTIISGFTKVLAKLDDETKKNEIANKIEKATERVKRVISSLKKYSQTSSTIQKSNINLYDLIEDILIILNNSLTKKI